MTGTGSGRIFAVVGPSGAGKDTLIAAARHARPDLHVVRRVITRPESLGGEPFEGVSQEEFDRRAAEGAFALTWQAHGLTYGIPATVAGMLAQGRDVVFNGSRAMIAEAGRAFPGLTVILVTAPPEVLAERLAARGREPAEAVAARLARAPLALPQGVRVRVVDNGGPLDRAVADFLAALGPEAGQPGRDGPGDRSAAPPLGDAGPGLRA